MYGLDYRTLKVGDEVGVVSSSSGYGLRNIGVYVVAKIDKIKVVVRRASDGYEKVFSIKKGYQMGEDTSVFQRQWLEPVADFKARVARDEKAKSIRSAWMVVASCASQFKLEELKAAIAKLEELQVQEI